MDALLFAGNVLVGWGVSTAMFVFTKQALIFAQEQVWDYTVGPSIWDMVTKNSVIGLDSSIAFIDGLPVVGDTISTEFDPIILRDILDPVPGLVTAAVVAFGTYNEGGIPIYVSAIVGLFVGGIYAVTVGGTGSFLSRL